MTIIDGKLIITWQIEDVLMRAEEQDIPCTEDQALGILVGMDHYHDCTLGITWDTIDYWLCHLAEEQG